jgi:hypothetical protein
VKLRTLSSAIIFTFAFLGGWTIGVEPPSYVIPEFVERNKPETQVPVPECIQKDLYQAACKFLEGVYPDVDKDWMRKEFGKALLKDRYGLQRLNNPMVRFIVKDVIQMEMTFPWCDVIEVAANRPPPGVIPEKLEKPLTLEDAEIRARRVLARVVGDANAAGRFEVTESGEAQSNCDYFRFVEFARWSGHPALIGVYIHVRRSDGFIQRCEWIALRLRPKLPYEKVAEMAKAIPVGDLGPGKICLEMRFRGGVGTLVWTYYVPPHPGGGELHETWWDAMTGELLYSKVLHGATC